MDFCEIHPIPLVANMHLTPSLDRVFKHVPQVSHQFHAYSVAEARQSVLNSLRMLLAELPDVKLMSPEALDQLTQYNADYFYSIFPARSAALSAYLPTLTVVCSSMVSTFVSISPISAGNGNVCFSTLISSFAVPLVVSFTFLKTHLRGLLALIRLFCTFRYQSFLPSRS